MDSLTGLPFPRFGVADKQSDKLTKFTEYATGHTVMPKAKDFIAY